MYNSAAIETLIVDDVARFRDAERSLLSCYKIIHIVGEASNGLDAVRKALELRPTLMLLDISLPGLNGIECARRILESLPDTTVLFVSMHSNSLIVEQALAAGARGYILKASAARDLWPAIQAVMRGERYVSEQLRFVEVNAPV